MKKNHCPLNETMMDMTWGEVEKIAKKSSLAFLPVGTIEAHGPHLPLGTDTYGALELAKACRRMLKRRGVDSVVAPPFMFGITDILSAFSGTFRIRKITMIELMRDFSLSLKRHGFTRQVVVNHHLEKAHINALLEAMDVAAQEGEVSIYLLGDKDILGRLDPGVNRDRLIISSWTTRESGLLSNYNDFHAGEKETSFVLHFYPRLVRTGWKKVGPCFPELSAWRTGGKTTRKATPFAYFGDPSRASTRKGQIIYRKIAEGYVNALIEKFFKHVTKR
jgi:creatinine amidohydrolase